jgi:hypothetical protein
MLVPRRETPVLSFFWKMLRFLLLFFFRGQV